MRNLEFNKSLQHVLVFAASVQNKEYVLASDGLHPTFNTPRTMNDEQ